MRVVTDDVLGLDGCACLRPRETLRERQLANLVQWTFHRIILANRTGHRETQQAHSIIRGSNSIGVPLKHDLGLGDAGVERELFVAAAILTIARRDEARSSSDPVDCGAKSGRAEEEGPANGSAPMPQPSGHQTTWPEIAS